MEPDRESSKPQSRSQSAEAILQEFRAGLPPEHLGTKLTREQEDEILGLGKDGV